MNRHEMTLLPAGRVYELKGYPGCGLCAGTVRSLWQISDEDVPLHLTVSDEPTGALNEQRISLFLIRYRASSSLWTRVRWQHADDDVSLFHLNTATQFVQPLMLAWFGEKLHIKEEEGTSAAVSVWVTVSPHLCVNCGAGFCARDADTQTCPQWGAARCLSRL